ncbi:putative colanic acid biosynthesis acetyltransferase WcaF [Arthrobacter oryzae]|nr:putative colanic acid biosynthesis acetyltransferase WcaF [Arthrobacter oryzae]
MTNPLDDLRGGPTGVRVVDLSKAPGEQQAWDRPRGMVYLWAIAELLFITNPWQISSGLRVAVLRIFGAKIGANVIFRPRTRVKFPWKLTVGDNAWIGEGVWIHNQNSVLIGANSVLSQEVFVTTGTHAHRVDMGLLTRPVVVCDGAWVTSRCIVLGGSIIGRSSIVTPGTVVRAQIPENTVWGQPEAGPIGRRFDEI